MMSSRVRVTESEGKESTSASRPEALVKLMSAGRKLWAILEVGRREEEKVVVVSWVEWVRRGERRRAWHTDRPSGPELRRDRRVWDEVEVVERRVGVADTDVEEGKGIADEKVELVVEERRGERLECGSTNRAVLWLARVGTPLGEVVLRRTVLGVGCKGEALFPELWRKTPTSWLETGLEENTVLGRARAVLDWDNPARVLAVVEGDSIGSSSSPSAASMFSRFSSRLGSVSGMMVAGLGGERRR